jgi:Ca2+-binding EF-hand superfamily protein
VFFSHASRDGTVDKSRFILIMRKHGVSDSQVAEHMFSMFDFNGDGRVTFSEYSTAIMLLTQGMDTGNKLQCMFTFFF